MLRLWPGARDSPICEPDPTTPLRGMDAFALKENQRMARSVRFVFDSSHRTAGLCNHLRRPSRCRAALISATGHEFVPLPGQGLRKFGTGAAVLAPASQAAGPEPEQPSEFLLDQLAGCLCHGAEQHPALSRLFATLQRIFSSECLQQSRLRATAREWHRKLVELLEDDEDWPIVWSTWQTDASEYLLGVEFCEWLVPDAEEVRDTSSTFREAATVLPWLDYGCLELPTPASAPPSFERIVAISTESCSPFHVFHVSVLALRSVFSDCFTFLN